MAYRIEVTTRTGLVDSRGDHLVAQAAEELGIPIDHARVVDIYSIDYPLTESQAKQLQYGLLCDPVAEQSTLNQPVLDDWDFWVEVGYRPGVTDNVGATAHEGMVDLLSLRQNSSDCNKRAVFVSTGYAIWSKELDHNQLEALAYGMLANQLIEDVRIVSAAQAAAENWCVPHIPRVQLPPPQPIQTYQLAVSDEELMRLSRENTWALTLTEMQTIRDYFQSPETHSKRLERGLPADPTDVELECLAQTWSEHCKHKIFASNCNYRDTTTGESRRIENLFKTYIRNTTEMLANKKDWLISVFHDNAGAIRFTEDYHLTIKVETHNSPSALDPYGGALTGIVGVNRDPMGTGKGCRLLFNTDVFCFGPPDWQEELPPPLLHPRRIIRGVHRGVMDGANTSGIPDVNGAIVFDPRFVGKPLVFCGTGGLLPAEVGGEPGESKEVCVGDRVVMIGGRIGKDGIHGATFSSEALHQDSPATAVQIGDPITQRKVLDFVLEARDLNLYRSLTDNGAGGLSSSIGELATLSGGACIHIDRAPLKYAGLAAWEIFLSEAQERMTMVVPPEKWDAFADLAKRRSVEATDLGEFTDSGYLEVFYQGQVAACLDLDFLHNGWPVMELPAQWTPPPKRAPELPSNPDWGDQLLGVLGRLNVCSKEPFVRMYDHEVQGGSVLKPFQGVALDGPGDAAIVRPLLDRPGGVAVACGIVPRYSDLDAAAMAANAVDEAVRNLVAVGAPLDEIAALDNFCWPDPVATDANPDGAYKMAQLVRACDALQEVCLAYGVPLVSGKDSMKNDATIGGQKISIPPTLLVTAVAVMPDILRAVSMEFKRPLDLVYVLGRTHNELGASEYLAMLDQLGDLVPQVRTAENWALYQALAAATEAGVVASCHDCSDGGLAVALAESAFAADLGATVAIEQIPVADSLADVTTILFAESAGRFVVTVHPENQATFERLMDGQAARLVGEVTQEPQLRITHQQGQQVCVDKPLAQLKAAWQAPFSHY